MNRALSKWVTENASQSLCLLSILSNVGIEPMLLSTLVTHITVCNAHSNKSATSILKTIYSREIKHLKLLSSSFIGPEELVTWLSPIRVAELKTVFESKFYPRLPSHNLESKWWRFNDITYVKVLSKWKKKKVNKNSTLIAIFISRQVWRDGTYMRMLWLEFRQFPQIFSPNGTNYI